MIKANVLVSFPITTSWQSDYQRSEPRWELQACEALLSSSEISSVCTTKPIWNSSLPKPSKLHDEIDPTTFLLLQGFQPELRTLETNGVIINTYAHVSPESMLFLAEKYKEKAVFATGWVGDLDRERRLREIVGPGHIEELPLPHIQNPIYSRPFDNKILLWSQRGTAPDNQSARPAEPSDRTSIFKWVATQLSKTDLEFHVLTALNEPDLDFIGISSIEEVFWNMKDSEVLKDFKDRIILHPGLGWSKVLELYTKTKLMVCPISLGGAPIECAMHGIPHVSYTVDGPLVAAPVRLEAATISEHLNHLDRLLDDKEFYEYVGESQREFVNKHYTYSNFISKLTEITSRRGMG